MCACLYDFSFLLEKMKYEVFKINYSYFYEFTFEPLKIPVVGEYDGRSLKAIALQRTVNTLGP